MHRINTDKLIKLFKSGTPMSQIAAEFKVSSNTIKNKIKKLPNGKNIQKERSYSKLYPIEKGIPLPKRTAGAYGMYPFRYMKVMDSFFVPAEDRDANSVMQSVSTYKRRNPNLNFISRRVSGGLRIWRVK